MRGDVGRGSRASDSIVMIAGKAGDGDDVAGARHRHAQRRLGIELCVAGALGKLAILADAIDADVGQGRGDMSLCALDGQSAECRGVHVLEVPQGCGGCRHLLHHLDAIEVAGGGGGYLDIALTDFTRCGGMVGGVG